MATRIAEILGTNTEATTNAMVQVDATLSVEYTDPERLDEESQTDSHEVMAEGLSYQEYGSRIGSMLGVNGQRVAQALAPGLWGAILRGAGNLGCRKWTAYRRQDRSRRRLHQAGHCWITPIGASWWPALGLGSAPAFLRIMQDPN